MVGSCRGDEDVAAATQAAQVAALNALAVLRAACDGDLTRVLALTRLRGFVRSDAAFAKHSAVLDGSSQVLAWAFPQLALPARTAVGVPSLPSGCWIEIELEALVQPG